MAFPTGWARKCKITIPAAQISGSNSDFPVLLTKENFPAEMLDAGPNSVLNGGGDLRFSEDGAGAVPLACDIVTLITSAVPINQEAEVWVRLLTLNSAAAKEFYVWYDKAGETQPAVTDPTGRNAVWSEAECAVLMESAAPIDHTGNHILGLTGTLDNISGPFGRANSFSGVDRLSNTDAALKDILLTYDTTVSVVSRKESFVSNRAVMSFDGSDDFNLYPMEDDGSPNEGIRAFWRDITSAMYAHNVAAVNTWGWLGFTTRASNDHEMYQNGTSVSTSAATGSAGPFSTFYIGGWGAQHWDGDIAQVVVWKTARTTDWLLTEYNNQFFPTAFAAASAPEAVSGAAVLTLQEAAHGFFSDGLTVTQFQTLTLSPAMHTHEAADLTLTQGQLLTNHNSDHTLVSDGPTVTLAGFLTVSGGRQAVVSGEVSLMQLQILICQNATHGLSSDVAALLDPANFQANPDRTHKAIRTDRTFHPTSNRTLRI